MKREMTKPNTPNHNKVRKKIVVNCFVIIILLSLSILLYIRAKASIEINQLFYSETSNLDYLVFLKENDFYTEKFLKKDKQYIANLIDYIESDYKYVFNASSAFDYTYKYYLTAKVIANEKGDTKKILFSQEETITPEEKITKDDSDNFIIKGNFKIDYQKYNDLITAFKRTYTLSIDSKLIITLHIELDGNHASFVNAVNVNRTLSMHIPLSEQTIGISVDYNEVNDANLLEEKSNKGIFSTLLYVLCFTCLAVSLPVVYFLIRNIKKLKMLKSKYLREYHKIMKEYNQIIVKTKKLPQIDKLEIIEIETFKELLDVRESIQKPILHIEIIPKEESWFVILNQEEIYRYILDSKE